MHLQACEAGTAISRAVLYHVVSEVARCSKGSDLASIQTLAPSRIPVATGHWTLLLSTMADADAETGIGAARYVRGASIRIRLALVHDHSAHTHFAAAAAAAAHNRCSEDSYAAVQDPPGWRSACVYILSTALCREQQQLHSKWL